MKYRKILLLLIYVSLTASLSCNRVEKRGVDCNPTYEIDVRKEINSSSKQFFLSDFVKGIRYIPLETNDSCLLSKIICLHYSQKCILASDSKGLYKFDLEGKFVRQIGHLGKGPSEHGIWFKFKVNTFLEEIYLLYKKKMIVFDINSGEFKRSFKLKSLIANFEFLGNNSIAFFPMEFNPIKFKSESSDNDVLVTDQNGKLINTIVDKERLNNRNNVAGYVHAFKRKTGVFYMGSYKDTMYKLDDKMNKTCYVKFNLNNKEKWETLIIEPNMGDKLADFVTISKPNEDEGYFFLSVKEGLKTKIKPTIHKMIYRKSTKELYKTMGLENDIDGGMIFWPDYIVSNNNFVSICSSQEMIDYADKNNGYATHKTSKFYELVPKLNAGDNPILIVGEL